MRVKGVSWDGDDGDDDVCQSPHKEMKTKIRGCVCLSGCKIMLKSSKQPPI